MTEHEALSHVNLEVVLLLAGMMSLANIFARTGAFDWAAIRAAQLVRGDGFLTLCLLCVITAIGSAFLDNVTVVVLAVPITLSICRMLDVNPVPYLLAQVFASNIGGVSTIVADPPNIIIAAEANIGFLDFMLNAAPVGIAGMFVLIGMLYLWFRKSTVTTAESRATRDAPGCLHSHNGTRPAEEVRRRTCIHRCWLSHSRSDPLWDLRS